MSKEERLQTGNATKHHEKDKKDAPLWNLPGPAGVASVEKTPSHRGTPAQPVRETFDLEGDGGYNSDDDAFGLGPTSPVFQASLASPKVGSSTHTCKKLPYRRSPRTTAQYPAQRW